MASIADLLGVQWQGATSSGYTLHPHAARQAAEKGFSRADVLDAANNPSIASDNGRYPGQKRHVKGDICAVVDPERNHVITVYKNVAETAVRPDQTDSDAQSFKRKSKIAANR